MTDYLTSFLGLFLATENQMLLMFASSFLSATLLPGNSEIVFSTLVSQQLLGSGTALSLTALLLVATVGNSLGSLTTYAIARLAPQPKFDPHRPNTTWAIRMSQQYGAWILLLSWLPVVGDVLCGVAGWLRVPVWQSVICITLGKGVRYAVILWGLYAVIG